MSRGTEDADHAISFERRSSEPFTYLLDVEARGFSEGPNPSVLYSRNGGQENTVFWFLSLQLAEYSKVWRENNAMNRANSGSFAHVVMLSHKDRVLHPRNIRVTHISCSRS